MGRSAARDSLATNDAVQQAASEQVALRPSTSTSLSGINGGGTGGSISDGYATRMTSLPANHKPAISNDMDTAASSHLIKPTKLTSLVSDQSTMLNSVYVSAIPMSSVIVEPVQ